MHRILLLTLCAIIIAGGLYFLIRFVERGGSMIVSVAGGLIIAFGAYPIWKDLRAVGDREKW
jgi:hypothetical protein